MILLISMHITISSPEGKYENGDDVIQTDTFLYFVKTKIE